MLLVLQTKFSGGKYENEVRVFASLEKQDPVAGLYLKDFDSKLVLQETIFDARCEEAAACLQAISGAIGEEVRLIQGRLAFGSFNIVEDKQRTKAMPNPTAARR